MQDPVMKIMEMDIHALYACVAAESHPAKRAAINIMWVITHAQNKDFDQRDLDTFESLIRGEYVRNPAPPEQCLRLEHQGYVYFVGGYWNAGHGRIAVVAVLNPGLGKEGIPVDWAAYIGGVNGQPIARTVIDAAETGGKLTEEEALRWFGGVKELQGVPYRGVGWDRAVLSEAEPRRANGAT